MKMGLFVITILVSLMLFSVNSYAACTYAGGNWNITDTEDCTLTGQSLNMSGNLTVYGNLTLSDVDFFVNTTNYLSNNISVGSGGTLRILDGTRILSNNSNYSYTIVSNSNTILEIRDSFISNYGYSGTGTCAGSGHGGIIILTNWTDIINTTFSEGGNQIIFTGSYNNLIENNTVNGTHPINCDNAFGFYVETDNNTLRNNVVYENQGSGIVIIGKQNTVVDNTAYSNGRAGGIHGGAGIFIEGHNNTVANNTAHSNRFYNICLNAADDNNVTENNVMGNGTDNNEEYGIALLASSDRNLIKDNTVYSNARTGISISQSANNTVMNNVVNSNNMGIGVLGSSNIASCTGASAIYNNITNNTIDSATLYGIYLSCASDAYLTENTLNYNAFGLYIYTKAGKEAYYNHTIDTTNTVNSKPIYYYHNKENEILSPSNPGWAGCYNCSNVTFRDFTVSESGNGILFAGTNNSNVTNVTIGNNYVGFLFSLYSNNNTVGSSFIYESEYQNIVDYGTNNIFLTDNIYMYDMIVPATNTWYISFDEMSFKLSNLTYGNMSCSQYINSTVTKTVYPVEANNKTAFNYVIPEGPHSYHFYCADINSGDIFDFATSPVNFGIKMSLGASCTADIQCASGYCTNGICSLSKSSSYVAPQGSLPSAPTTIPLTKGNVFIPSGGLVMILDNDTTLDLYGTNAYINDIYVIDPNSLSPISCNQTSLSSYEIDVDIDDKAYVCFDRADYSDLQSITVYTIKENEWKELDEIVIKGDKICGRITSSPYMIAGFSIPATADKALESIQLASSIADTDESKSLVDDASQAYLHCEYDRAYDLSQNAIRASSEINISRETAAMTATAIIIFLIAYYFAKHPIKLKKSKRKK